MTDGASLLLRWVGKAFNKSETLMMGRKQFCNSTKVL